MNTCCAGAALTTRSKRGSTGAPAACGISALSGGSSASRTATDWFDAACLAALSISATILSSTLYGPAQETSKAVNAVTLIRFMSSLLPLLGGFRLFLSGRPVSPSSIHGRIELDDFGRVALSQYDLLGADSHQSRGAVAPAKIDGPAIDRHLAPVFCDDHDLRGRRAPCGLVGAGGSADNFPRRPHGIAQPLCENPRRAERDDERDTEGQISSHVFSGLSV